MESETLVLQIFFDIGFFKKSFPNAYFRIMENGYIEDFVALWSDN